MKEAVLDLEGIACHKGSAFGNLGQPTQPKQEMFENLLATRLYELMELQGTTHIWTEDESQRIGEVNIPIKFYSFLRTRTLYFMDIPFEERLNYIVEQYGQFEKEKLINATVRIQKRLGGLETKTAVNCLLENDTKGAFAILLKYYDKFYNKSMHNQRENVELLMHKITMPQVNPSLNAEQVKRAYSNRVVSSTSL
jgi:tRNA 2-selenouridine synthase